MNMLGQHRQILLLALIVLIVTQVFNCTNALLIQDSGNQTTADTTKVVQYAVQSPTPELQGPKQSVAIYMVGMEPSALKGAYKVIGSELAKALTGSNTYSAVDRTEDALKIIEKEHIYQRSGAVDEKQIKELGKQLGVKFLCIAEINEVMDSYHLDVRLVDVETAVVINVVSKPCAMKDVYQVVETAKDTALELLGGQGK